MAERRVASFENHLHDIEPRWFAIRTRYKAEKQVVKMLNKKGIEAYIPINSVVRKYKRKKRQVDLPLIHCYAFVRIIKNQYISVLQTEHVDGFVNFKRNLICIPEAEMELMKRVCSTFSNVQIEEVDFEPGLPVEIIGGGMTGLKGRMVEGRGRNVVVILEELGLGLHIEVEKKWLKALRKRA